jgi:hypothetical protein
MTTIDQLGSAHDGNGLYAKKNQSRPEVQLLPTNDGSFLFPPVSYGTPGEPNDVKSYVEFWTTSPISDGVLTNISGGYADLVRRQKAVDSLEWGRFYDAQNHKALTSGSDASKATALAARADSYEKFFASWHETRPEKIKAGTARSIARAGQLRYYSAALSEADRDVIYQSTMLIGEDELTVHQITDRYRLSELRDFFQDPEATAAERLEDLRQELRRMQQVG